MKKLAVASMPIVLGAFSCGGTGLSDYTPTFDTVTVVIANAQPNPLESDVVIHTPVQAPVLSAPSTGCNAIAVANDVCIGAVYRAENVDITFNVEPLKNVKGEPVVELPSPVLVEKYKVSFTGCIPGIYEFPVGAVLQPTGDSTVTIQPITQDMKIAITEIINYIYINQDGCPTLLQRASYPSICNALANFEFDVVEIYSGKKKTIKYSLAIRLADYGEQDQCR